MKFIIKHEIKGRMRVHLLQNRMTFEQADTLLYYLSSQKLVTGVKVREKTQDATINFVGDREEVIRALKAFHYETAKVPEVYLKNSGRELQNEYWEKLVNKVVMRMGSKMFLPVSVRSVITAIKSVKYLWHGVRTLAKGKLEVPVLDATAIGVSIFRGDFETAGSTMFLLGVGEILEEWTHKKSVDDLARSMSLHVSKVWMVKDGQEILVPADQIQAGDEIVVHMGNVIPFDGVVTAGDAMVNQASLTGESVPVQKNAQKYAYAGTVVEEGELTICVNSSAGNENGTAAPGEQQKTRQCDQSACPRRPFQTTVHDFPQRYGSIRVRDRTGNECAPETPEASRKACVITAKRLKAIVWRKPRQARSPCRSGRSGPRCSGPPTSRGRFPDDGVPVRKRMIQTRCP